MDRLNIEFQLTRSVQTVGCVMLCLLFGLADQAAAQLHIRLGGGQVMVNEQDKDKIESGGVLKTNPDLESILQQAERIKEDGNYPVATELWQAVLQRSGDSLFSSDGTTYFSLVQQVEAILANLPPEGLAAYRVHADANAKEILAQADSPTDTEALNQIVRQYFISSLGDEAAFSLGCVYLDRYDFIGARRMFEKIAQQYPDPTVPMDEVYSRIALCQSFLGDTKMAEVSLTRATEINATADKTDLIRDSLGKLNTFDSTESFNSSWKLQLGDPRRYGAMAPIPEEMMKQDLAAVWQFYYTPLENYKRPADVAGSMLSGKQASGSTVLDTRDKVEERMITAWRDKGWRPAGHLLIDGDSIYFKTGSDVSVWSRSKVGKAIKKDQKQTDLDSAIQWRSVWNNAFEIDEATQMMEMIRQNFNQVRRGTSSVNGNKSQVPTGKTEVQMFGDIIYQQMSIHKNRLYTIEGKRFSGTRKSRTSTIRPQYNASVRRSRVNYLTSYDSVSGHVQWSLPREVEEDEDDAAAVATETEEPPWLASGGFMSAPIGFGDLIIVPVNNSGAISIYALDPKQEGKTVWKSFLCDEPETGAMPWSAIDLSIDGSDLFVSCGMGVVFVLDPASGTIRFAKRYDRVGTTNALQQRNGWMPNRMNFDGWSSDIIVPYGRQMICFNSDAETIEAFDRNTGKTIWRSEMRPIGFKVDYILGVYDDMLYAAGPETIVAYDLKGEGRMIWGADQTFNGQLSLGRGMLTPDGIYMPVQDSIYKFALKGKSGRAHVLGKVHVDLGTGAPVGNLYSDGERFWVHGANRLYALGHAPERTEEEKEENKKKKTSRLDSTTERRLANNNAGPNELTGKQELKAKFNRFSPNRNQPWPKPFEVRKLDATEMRQLALPIKFNPRRLPAPKIIPLPPKVEPKTEDQ